MKTEEIKKQAETETERQGNFVLKPSGLYVEKEDKDGTKLLILICSRIEVVAKVRDENSEAWGRLIRFMDSQGIVHEWSLPMRMLAGDATELRAILLDLGLHITPGRERSQLSTYFQTWRVKEYMTAVERTGWHKGAFVMPEMIIGQNGQNLVYQTEAVKRRTFGQSGSAEEWSANVASLCTGNSRLVFVVSAAFAAVLLKLVNEDGGGFHFLGGSSIGKTTILRVGCSVCGPWFDFKSSWRATDNGLEGVAESRNDAPLILDELSEIDPRHAGKVAYMLGNGQGKQRANKLGNARALKKWRLLFLSTGEIGLSDHMSATGGRARAGQEVRMVDIPADAGANFGCFEDLHDHKDGSLFADKLMEVSSQYYGTPFVQFLKEITDTGFDKVKIYVKNNMEDVARGLCPSGSEGQVKRVAKRFALVGVAGEMASRITGWPEGTSIAAAERCFDDWLDARGGHRDQEVKQVKDRLFAFLEQHGQGRFQGLGLEGSGIVFSRAGFREMVDGITHYYILTSAMREIYKGENLKRATAILVSEGVLRPDGAGKSSISKTLPDLGKQRCYHVAELEA